MRKLILLLIFIFVSGCYTGNVVVDNALKLEGPFLVLNVVDGDTLDLNSSDRVRLSGINTPETGECYYQEAKDKLKSLTLNKIVYVEKDITNGDKYGRILRYIYVNNVMINSVLVREGYARVYDKYASDTKRYNELKQIEKIAIDGALGIWNCTDAKADCLYVGSKTTKTYHKPDCKWAKRIQPDNLICYKTQEEVKDLNPCGTCNP